MEKMSQTIQRKEKGRERRRARTGEYHPGAVHAPRDQSSRTLILCKGCGAVEREWGKGRNWRSEDGRWKTSRRN
jgi:hypothetical protein